MSVAKSVLAGRAVVELGLRDRLTAALRSASKRLKTFGDSMGKVGRPLAGFGLALGVPIAFATKQFANFDDAIRMVGAVTQATGADFTALENTALELGRTTSFTATEVALLMAELGRAGFSPDQVNKMTGAVLDLSKATGTDATLASGIMAATIRQFGLQASDAARVADTLTMAANKSFNSVEQLGEALGYAGPVAADFGMSIEDTLAILGSLGNVGIQGSEAGTALRRLLTLTGGDAQRLQQIFGVAFVDAAGNARPLVDVLGEVNLATQNLGTGDRAAKFSEAFGLLGITAASALGRAAGDTRDLRNALNEAAGTARKTAEEMEAGLGGTFRKIMSALEGLQIAFGKAIAPALQSLEKVITSTLGALTQWLESNSLITTVVVAAIAGLAALGVGLIVAGKAFGLLGGAVAMLVPKFSLFGSAILFLPRLFSRSVANMRGSLKRMSVQSRKAADELISIFGTTGRYVTGFFGLIARQASSTATYLRPLVIGAYRASQAFGAALYSASLSAFAGLQVGARATARAVQSSWEWLAANAPAAWNRVDAVGRSVFRRLGEYATAASPLIRGVTLLVGREVSKIWAGTVETVNAITSPFTTRIAAGWQKMAIKISAASRWVKTDVAKTFGGLRAEIAEDYNWLKTSAAATWASISATTAKHAAKVHAVTARAYSAVSGVVNRQLERVSAANQYVVGRLVAHWNSYPRWVREPISKISGMLATDGAKGVAAIRGVFARIPGVASAALRGIKSVGSVAMQQLANTTRAVLSRSFVAVKAAGIGAFRGIRAAGVASMLAVTRATRTAAGKIGGAFSAVGTALSVLLPSGGGALGTLLIVFPLIATAIGSVAGAIGLLFTPLGAGIVLISALVAGFLYFTDEGGQALSVLRVLFRQTFRTFSEMFGGIRDALASGDWKAAANVLFTGLRVVWLEGINYLKSYWPQLAGAAKSAYEKILAFTISVGSDLTGAFAAAGQTIVNIWSNVPEWLRLPVEIAWASIVEIFTRGISWARMALTEFSIGIATVFDGAITTLRQSFNGLTMLILDGLAQAVGGFKSLLDMAAKYDPTGLSASMRDALPDAAAFAETARADMQRQNEQLERDREARDKRRSERLAATREDSDSQIAAAARRRQELFAKYAGLPGADIAKANADFMQALRDARKEEPQQAAAEDAKAAAQTAQQKPKLGNVQGRLEKLAEQAKSATVSGTFTSGIAAFQQLAAGGVQDVQRKLMERVAKATEQTAKNTQPGPVNGNGSPGLVFGE